MSLCMSTPALSDEVLQRAAECLRVVAHPARLRLVQLLLDDRLSVGELAAASGLAQHVTSEHLRLMERCGMLVSERENRRVYYRTSGSHLASLLDCIQQHFNHQESPHDD